MTIRRLSIHNRLNESPELIAQEFMVSTFSLESLVSLNESPELIAQEYPDWGFFEHGAVRASMKVLSLLLRNPWSHRKGQARYCASMKVLSLLLRNGTQAGVQGLVRYAASMKVLSLLLRNVGLGPLALRVVIASMKVLSLLLRNTPQRTKDAENRVPQ